MTIHVSHPTLTLEPESRFDVPARERLLDAAFGPDRFEKTSERLRSGRLPALAFSLKESGRLIGTVRLWPIMAGGVPALLLGPLAVAKSHEGRGFGARLMRHALTHAAAQGHRAVILVGDAPYYARFGFDCARTAGLIMPGPVDPERFLGLELFEGSLAAARGPVIAAGKRAPYSRRVDRSQEPRLRAA